MTRLDLAVAFMAVGLPFIYASAISEEAPNATNEGVKYSVVNNKDHWEVRISKIERNEPEEIVFEDTEKEKLLVDITYDELDERYDFIEEESWTGVRVTRKGDNCKTVIRDFERYDHIKVDGFTFAKKVLSEKVFTINCQSYVSKE